MPGRWKVERWEHSKLGASKAHRWTVCTASVAACAGLDSPATEPAAEGTAAHSVAEKALRAGLDAEDFRGCTVEADGFSFGVDDEMIEAAQLYLDVIRADLEKAGPGAKLLVEQRIDLSHLHVGMFGSTDATILAPSGLQVYDFKYGRGHVVEPENNAQMMFYGVGALWGIPNPPTAVELVIVQPRAPHKRGPVRRWGTLAGDLSSWALLTLQFKARETDTGGVFVAGDHCGFCPNAGKCPALRDAAAQKAMTVFSPVPVAPPAPANLTSAQLAEVLKNADMITTWLKSVWAFARTAAEAGNAPAGWKLVEVNGKRQWVDDKMVIDKIVDKSILYEEPKLKSPAQLEAALKKVRGLKPKEIASVMAGLTVAKTSTSLVPATDPRPAVTRLGFTPVSTTPDFLE